MKQIELDQATDIEQVIYEARTEDVVLTRQGRAVALVSELDDEELYWYAQERDPAFLASIERGRKQIQDGKGIAHEEMKARLGI